MRKITTFDELDKIIHEDKEKLYVIDFNAPWCAPCRAMSNIIDSLDESDLENTEIVSVDVDDDVDISSVYGIRSIPTFIFFKDGFMVHRFTGGIEKKEFIAKIKQNNAK